MRMVWLPCISAPISPRPLGGWAMRRISSGLMPMGMNCSSSPLSFSTPTAAYCAPACSQASAAMRSSSVSSEVSRTNSRLARCRVAKRSSNCSRVKVFIGLT